MLGPQHTEPTGRSNFMGYSRSGPHRAARLLALREMLFVRAYTAAELADRLGVSQRTIYRDLVDLQLWPLNIALSRCDGRWRAFDPRLN